MSTENREVLTEDQALEMHKSITQRHKKVNDEMIRARTELEGFERDLEKEKKESEAEIGTSDIAECRKIYGEQRQQNSDNIYDVSDKLDNVEALLAGIKETRAELKGA